MKITFTVGAEEKTLVEFTRDCFLGKIRIKADGKEVYSNRIADLSTQFEMMDMTRCYDVTVGEKEIKKIQIRKTRPRLWPGLRPQTYEVFCDGQLITTRKGY